MCLRISEQLETFIGHALYTKEFSCKCKLECATVLIDRFTLKVLLNIKDVADKLQVGRTPICDYTMSWFPPQQVSSLRISHSIPAKIKMPRTTQRMMTQTGCSMLF